MLKLEAIKNNTAISGIEPGHVVRIITTEPVGDSALTIYYKTPDGRLLERTLLRTDEANLSLAEVCRPWTTAEGRGTGVRRLLHYFLLLIALWAVQVFFIGDLVFTGDEPRYVAYGLGIWHGEGFHPSDEHWQEMLGERAKSSPLVTSPAGQHQPLIHSIVYPVLGSVAIYLGGLDGARWFSFGLCIAGLTILYLSMRKNFEHETCLIAVAAVALGCPLIFYMHLFFSEILLFVVNCIVVWIFISRKHEDSRWFHPVGLFFCLLPFVHVKMALEAAVGFVLLLLAARRAGAPLSKLAAACAMGAIMFGLYVLHNKLLFGVFIGGASPAFPVSPVVIPDRIIVNLFDMRHGIIPNAPQMLFGLIGLFWLLCRKEDPAKLLCILFGAYFFTMLWANGSEAYAGRNWTAAMPFLAYGFARWYKSANLAQLSLSLPILVLSACLFCVVLREPNAFLASRNYSVPYDTLFQMTHVFNFGYFLPYDFLDHDGAKPNISIVLGLANLAVVGLYIVGHCLATKSSRGILAAGMQFLAIGTTVYFALVEKVESPAVAIIHDSEKAYVNISLEKPRPLAFVKFENPGSSMTPYGFFLVGERNAENIRYSLQRASSVVPLSPFCAVDAVMIAETADYKGRLWLDGTREVTAYARLIHLLMIDN